MSSMLTWWPVNSVMVVTEVWPASLMLSRHRIKQKKKTNRRPGACEKQATTKRAVAQLWSLGFDVRKAPEAARAGPRAVGGVRS